MILHSTLLTGFANRAIVIHCRSAMRATQLCDALFEHVFSCIGLPRESIGFGATHLRADKQVVITHSELGVSNAYRPQMDGSTERFQSKFQTNVVCILHEISQLLAQVA